MGKVKHVTGLYIYDRGELDEDKVNVKITHFLWGVQGLFQSSHFGFKQQVNAGVTNHINRGSLSFRLI